MVGKVKHVVWFTSKLSLKMLAVFIVLAALVIGAFVWRVSSRPFDISFVKKSIEAAIYDRATGNYIQMDKAVLFWPDLNGPLYLQIHNGQFFNKDSVLIGSIGQIDASFSSLGLLMGRILPKAIIIKEPTVRIARGEDGSIFFDIAADTKNVPIEEVPAKDGTGDIIHEMLSYIASPVREGGIWSGSLLSQLRGFSIDNARLFVDDKVLHQTWSLPYFDLAFMSTAGGAGGYAHMTLPGSGGDGPALSVAVDYDWWNGRIDLSTDVRALNVNDIISKIPALAVPASQDAVISAHIEVTLNDNNFMPSEVRIDALSEGGKINHPKLSEEPIVYENLAFSALYDYAGKVLQLRDTHISLGGVMFNFSGDLTRKDDKIYGPMHIWAKDAPHARIEALWPKFLKGDDAEKWVVQRMSDGVFESLSAQLDLIVEKQLEQLPVSEIEPEAGETQRAFEFVAGIEEPSSRGVKIKAEKEPVGVWRADVNNVLVDFKAKDMSVDYHAPLEKISHLYGSGQFDVGKDTLSVDIEKAKIGNMDVGISKLYFDRLVEEGVGDADMRFELKGSVADILRYISSEPINLGDDIGMDIDKVKGKAELKIWLNFPARKSVLMSEFKIDIGGKLIDVLFPSVVKDLDISGRSLELSVKDNLVKLHGASLLDGRKTELSWEAFLKSKGQAYKEKVQAKLRVDEDLRKRLGIDLSEFLEGSLDTELTYTTYQDGTARANVTADMKHARLFIDPFDYEKAEGQDGEVSFNAALKNGTLKKITSLSAKAPEFTMSNGEVLFTEKNGEVVLASGKAPKFSLGETNASLSFAFDKHRAVDITLDGEFLDARPFMDSEGQKEEYDAPAMRIKVKASKVRMESEQLAKDFIVNMVIDEQGRFDRIEMDGHIGSSDVAVRFNKVGKRTFRMMSEDAGALLKAFGIYDNVVGGTMAIYGEPIRGVNDRNLSGKAEISNFKVVKAPALAKLLSLLSLGGITEVLANDGLHFDRMEADFSWLYRKNGSLLELRNGRTSGNALGLLFEGTFDNQKREVDVSGTVAPMDTLNKVLGKIPLVGNILTGGEGGGVFAATYSIKGSSDDPRVSVNPLSVLTPGILRRILWE